MNANEESRVGCGACIAIIILAILVSLCGCKTKTVTITETVYVHDTVTSHKTDTLIDVRVKTDSVVEYKFLTLHDTTIIERGNTLVLKENGDTLKQSEWEKIWQKIQEKENLQHNEIHTDSTSFYKAQNDSLRKALDKEKSKDKTIVKRYFIPWWLIFTFVVVISALCVWVLVKGKKKFVDKI